MVTAVRRGATAAGDAGGDGTEDGSGDYDANDDGSDGADSSAVVRGSADAVRVDAEVVLLLLARMLDGGMAMLAASMAGPARAAGMDWRPLTRAERQAAALERRPDGMI